MQLLSVNYHYIREEKYKSGIYPMSLFEFEKQLDELSLNYIFISQDELIKKLQNQDFDDKKYCLITFDDGLKEQMKAARLMNKKGIPGIFYVTTDAIENNIVVDVHKLHYIRSVLNDEDIFNKLDIMFNISQYEFNMDKLQKQYRYDNLLAQKVKYYINFILSKKDKKEFVDTLFKELVADEKEFSAKLYMDNNDIKVLDQLGMLGTHSASHSPLAVLTDEEMRYDIQKSLDFFKSIGINSLDSISYPYGSKAAVDENVANISEEFGFKFGITMYRGVNNIKELRNERMLLKRVSCSDIVDGGISL